MVPHHRNLGFTFKGGMQIGRDAQRSPSPSVGGRIYRKLLLLMYGSCPRLTSPRPAGHVMVVGQLNKNKIRVVRVQLIPLTGINWTNGEGIRAIVRGQTDKKGSTRTWSAFREEFRENLNSSVVKRLIKGLTDSFHLRHVSALREKSGGGVEFSGGRVA
eukprot:220454-Prorocentrum_minimum.AAC.1